MLDATDNTLGSCVAYCPLDQRMSGIVSRASVYICYQDTKSPYHDTSIPTTLKDDLSTYYFKNSIPSCAEYLHPGQCKACVGTGAAGLGTDCNTCAEGYSIQDNACLKNQITFDDSNATTQGMLLNDSRLGKVNF